MSCLPQRCLTAKRHLKRGGKTFRPGPFASRQLERKKPNSTLITTDSTQRKRGGKKEEAKRISGSRKEEETRGDLRKVKLVEVNKKKRTATSRSHQPAPAHQARNQQEAKCNLLFLEQREREKRGGSK